MIKKQPLKKNDKLPISVKLPPKNEKPPAPVKLPSNIVSKPSTSDYVSFSAIHNKTENKADHDRQACYASYMSRLSEHMFICRPLGGAKFILPDEDFLKWMELCKKNNLLPPASEVLIEKGEPIARIPGGNESKHRVYTALCCYRYAESIAPLAYEAVRLSEERPNLDFFQIMHYVIGKYVSHVGHSFTNICNASYSMYGGDSGGCRGDLVHTIGMKWWFHTDEMGQSLCSAGTGPTNSTLFSYCQGLGFNVKIKHETEALEPKYTPLYKVPVGKIEEVKSILKSIK